RFTLSKLLEELVSKNKQEKHKWFLGLLKQYGSAKANLSYLEEENKKLTDAVSAPSKKNSLILNG
ncbi:MAG TPA: hypothetical protein VF455_04695, partial [Chryseobacterium sp.]